MKVIFFQTISVLVLFLFQLSHHVASNHDIEPWPNAPEPAPTPQPWPERFYAYLYNVNRTSTHLNLAYHYYNWPKGYKMNLIIEQLGRRFNHSEWKNGTNFSYILDNAQCNVSNSGPGIPPPDFLKTARYLGRVMTDGFLCNLWEKVGVIRYYEDVATKQPVRWDTNDGVTSHVLVFEDGVLQDSTVQAPAFCFKKPKAVDDYVVSA